MKVAGVVVLYHPDESVLENIKTYIDDIDLLFAVDNSDKKNIKIVESLKKFLQHIICSPAILIHRQQIIITAF